MLSGLQIRKVVLYRHGVGFFEREGAVTGTAQLDLGFRTAEVSDVLKSLTVLDLDGGLVRSISYDADTPVAKRLEDVAIDLSDGTGLAGLLPQLQGAEIEVEVGSQRIRGRCIGIDKPQRVIDGRTIVTACLLTVVTDDATTVRIDLDDARSVRLLDEALRRDLDYVLQTHLAARKKDTRTFTFFCEGEGERRLRVSYTLETPVWKATYRILLPANDVDEPLVQGWAVVDNTQEEDWENVELSLVAGLPISFVHDLYGARYLRRPVVEVMEQSSLAPPIVADAIYMAKGGSGYAAAAEGSPDMMFMAAPAAAGRGVSSVEVQTRQRQVGDLFRYDITHPVTIRRNQSALVPIVLESFRGRAVLLYDPETRPGNPLSAVEFENTTGLTLEGGPVTVLEGDTYVGEAMVETIKPADTRLIPYSVELGVVADACPRTRIETVHRTRVSRGVLQMFSMEVRETAYAFRNKGDSARVLFCQHRRDTRWDLVDPALAHETTSEHYRFRTEIAAGVTTEYLVGERREIVHSIGLAGATDDMVAEWSSSRYLDERVTETMRRVLALKNDAVRLDDVHRAIVAELGAIANDQQRIRENLRSIGEGHDEKRLRTTLVEKLLGQERRIEELATDQRRVEDERAALQREIDAAILGLEFEARVG